MIFLYHFTGCLLILHSSFLVLIILPLNSFWLQSIPSPPPASSSLSGTFPSHVHWSSHTHLWPPQHHSLLDQWDHIIESPSLPFMPLASQTSFFKAQGGMGITHSIWLSPGKVETHLFCYCRDLATHHRAGRKQEFCFRIRKLEGDRLLCFCLGLKYISCCSKKSRHFPESQETAQCEGMYCIESEVHGVSNSNAYGGKGNKVPSERNTELSVKKNGKRP